MDISLFVAWDPFKTYYILAWKHALCSRVRLQKRLRVDVEIDLNDVTKMDFY